MSSAASSAPHPGGREVGCVPFAVPRYRPALQPLSQGSGRRSALPRLSWAVCPCRWAQGKGGRGACRGRSSRHSAGRGIRREADRGPSWCPWAPRVHSLLLRGCYALVLLIFFIQGLTRPTRRHWRIHRECSREPLLPTRPPGSCPHWP